jgi:hypothetical protein
MSVYLDETVLKLLDKFFHHQVNLLDTTVTSFVDYFR